MTAQATEKSQVAKPENEFPSSELATFIDSVKRYKELILLVISLVSGTLFLRDYFATKIEVGVLRCEMLIQVDLSAIQAQLRDITGRILNVQRAMIPDDVPSTRRRELEFELRTLEADRQRSQSRLDVMEGRLRNDGCQRDAEG